MLIAKITAFPYDSQISEYAIDGTPIYDRAIGSSIFRDLFLKYFTEGVFPNPSTSFQVNENSTQGAIVKSGFANIRGVTVIDETDTEIAFEKSDTLDRIDRVVLRHDDTISVRNTSIVVLKGTPASNPQPPAITRNKTIWDLCLAEVRIIKNSQAVAQSNITDTRLNSQLCGIVTSTIETIDTTTLYNQVKNDFDNFRNQQQSEYQEMIEGKGNEFDVWFNSIKDLLGEDVAGSLQNQILDLKEEMDTLGEVYAKKTDVYTKEQMNTSLNEKQNKVLFGTTPPTNDMGVDGDIYIQIEA